MGGLPGAVLFACNANKVRSPMAEALMKLRFGRELYVDSCGARPDPERDPFVTEVMDELGADLSHHHAKSFSDVDPDSFDLIITLTPEAHHRALDAARGQAVSVEYWPTSDPTLTSGSREVILDAYRRTRDELEARIIRRFSRPATAGG